MSSCFLVPVGRILVFPALEALGNVCVCVCVCVYVCVCVSVCGEREREMIWKEKFVGDQCLSNPLQYSCLENPMDGRAW